EAGRPAAAQFSPLSTSSRAPITSKHTERLVRIACSRPLRFPIYTNPPARARASGPILPWFAAPSREDELLRPAAGARDRWVIRARARDLWFLPSPRLES